MKPYRRIDNTRTLVARLRAISRLLQREMKRHQIEATVTEGRHNG